MNCVNPNSREFIELQEESGLPVPLLTSKIGVWMDKNGTENFPTMEDLFIKKEIPTLSPIEVRYQVPQNRELEEFIASEKTIRDIASRMSHRIGIPVIFQNNSNELFKGKLEYNRAIINLAYATLDTPIHEILGHPIIRAIKNPALSERSHQSAILEYSNASIVEENGEFFIIKEDGSYWSHFDTKEEAEKELKILQNANSEESSQLYQNLLKELETGIGKEVLDRIKKDYQYKEEVYRSPSDKIKYKGVTSRIVYLKRDFKELNDLSPEEIFNLREPTKYTLEEQQEEAIVELLGMMVAQRLNKTKDSSLISLLKQLLKTINAFVKSLLTQKEIEISKLPETLTLGDLADILAYSNNKLLLPGTEVIYTTPDNSQFKTYTEASQHLSNLVKNIEDVDLSTIEINPKLSKEDLNRIAELKIQILNKQEHLISKEYKDYKSKEINRLEQELKAITNKKVVFKTQEPGLDLADKKKYGFLDYDYVRVESSYSRTKTVALDVPLWWKHFGEDFEGYYIHGYNTDKNKPSTKVVKISKEEAERIWKKEYDINPNWGLEVQDRQRIFQLESEISIIKGDITIKAQIDQLEQKIQSIENGGNSLLGFIKRNEDYERSKEIIEEWKRVNNIQYNPEEVYSRGQEFVSALGAYSAFEVDLLLQNLLHHIEDNEKAGGEFVISAFTRPKDTKLRHLEGDSKITYKIYPKSEDIKWAANTDVYSGSTWDAADTIAKGKKAELVGVSYTKAPAISNLDKVSPNLAEIIDKLDHHHNELGIALSGNNFRMEYAEDVPPYLKKIIDGINVILDQKYGKIVKPKIEETNIKEESYYDVLEFDGNGSPLATVRTNIATKEEAEDFIKNYKKYSPEEIETLKELGLWQDVAYLDYKEVVVKTSGIKPTQTKDNLKVSIFNIKDDIILSDKYGINSIPIEQIIFQSNVDREVYAQIKKDGTIRFFKTEESKDFGLDKEIPIIPNQEVEKELTEKINKDKRKKLQFNKEYNSQALINLKVARLKEVAKKYPRILIRSEIIDTSTQNNNFVDSLQKVPSTKKDNNSIAPIFLQGKEAIQSSLLATKFFRSFNKEIEPLKFKYAEAIKVIGATNAELGYKGLELKRRPYFGGKGREVYYVKINEQPILFSSNQVSENDETLNNILLNFLAKNFGTTTEQWDEVKQIRGFTVKAAANAVRNVISWAKGYESEIPEEAAHIIFELVDSKTKEAIINQILNSEEFLKFKQENEGMYATDREYAKELAGRKLAKAIKEEHNELRESSVIQSLLDKFIKFLKGMLSKINLSELDTTIESEFKMLAKDVLSGNTSKLSVKNVENTTLFSAEKTVEAIKEMSSQIVANEEEHTYTHEESGIVLTSVTTLADTMPFDDSQTSEEQKALYELQANLGTAFHGYVQSRIEGEVGDDSFTSLENIQTINNFVDSLIASVKKQDPEAQILVEQIIANLEHKVAGKVDLMVVWGDGSISIYDWKTITSNPTDWKYKIHKYPRFARQLGLYRAILETPSPSLGWEGTTVRDTFIIPVHNTVRGDKIHKLAFFNKTKVQKRDSINFVSTVMEDEIQSPETIIANELLDMLDKKISRLYHSNKSVEELEEVRLERQELSDLEVIAKELARLQVELAGYYASKETLRDDLTDDEIYELYKILESLEAISSIFLASMEDENLVDIFTKLNTYKERGYRALEKHLSERVSNFLKEFSSNPELSDKNLFLALNDITLISTWLGHSASSDNPIIALTDRVIKYINFQVEERFKEDAEAMIEAYRALEGEQDFMINEDGISFKSEINPEFYQRLKDFSEQIGEARAAGDVTLEEEIIKARKEFIKDNTTPRYTEEYYAIDTILDALPEEDRAAWENHRAAKAGITLKNKHLTPDKWSQDDIMEFQHFHQEQGKIQKKHKAIFDAYHKAFGQRFTTKTSETFERIKKERKREYQNNPEEFKLWEAEQYKIEYTSDYFDWVDRITSEGLADKSITDEERALITQLKEERALILYNLKDATGRVNGTLATESTVKNLLAIQKQFEALKKQLKAEKRGTQWLKSQTEYMSKHDFMPSVYYRNVIAEFKRAFGADYKNTEEYKEWFFNNHVYNSFSDSYEPLIIWTVPMYNGKEDYVSKTLLSNWLDFEVKEEYLNPEYKEDRNGNPLPNEKWRTNITFDGENWNNPEWSATQNKYYNEWRKLKEKADSLLPAKEGYSRYENPYTLPNVRKDGSVDFRKVLQVPLGQQVKQVTSYLGDRYKATPTDRVLLDESNEVIKGIPLYFVGTPKKGEVSTDLVNTLSAYHKMARNAHTKLSYKSTIEGIKIALSQAEASKISSTGVPMIDSILTKKRGVPTNQPVKGDATNVYKKIDTIIDANFYGVEDPEFILGNVDINKIVDDMMLYTSVKALGFNLFAGTANILLGQYLSMQEALGGQFFDGRAWREAELDYVADFTNIMSDLANGGKRSKVNALQDYFDTLQNQDELSRVPTPKEKKSKFKKLMRINSLFFLNHAGEHKMQNTLLTAMMKSYMIKDGEVTRITREDKIAAEKSGVPIKTIADMIEFKNGKIKSTLTENQKFKFRELVIGVSQMIHGVYTRQDRTLAQRTWLGKLAFQFRKWVIPGIKYRWGAEYHDERLMDTVEGYYETFRKFIISAVKERAFYGEAFKSKVKGLSRVQRANMRKALMESTTTIALLLIAGILHGLRDEDEDLKDSAVFGFTLYNIDRLRTELRFFRSVQDFQKIMRTPAAAESTLQDITEFLTELLIPPYDRYESGNRKGDLKLEKQFQDLVPILNQGNKISNMDDMLEFYRPKR